MSLAEYARMSRSGMVQESFSGTTHVAFPPDWRAFVRQAPRRSVYVEFDVPVSSLVKAGAGWAKVVGPHSVEGRLALAKGRPLPQMPRASSIALLASRWP